MSRCGSGGSGGIEPAYQDKTDSRGLDVTYENTTGSPLLVTVNIQAPFDADDTNDRVSARMWVDATDRYIVVDRFDTGYGFTDGDWTGWNVQVSGIVPDGETYLVEK